VYDYITYIYILILAFQPNEDVSLGKKDELSNILKFVHEISADIIKFFCISAELVHKMRML